VVDREEEEGRLETEQRGKEEGQVSAGMSTYSSLINSSVYYWIFVQ
jgi:hypothetical protein